LFSVEPLKGDNALIKLGSDSNPGMEILKGVSRN
jgi:hypothetical protein